MPIFKSARWRNTYLLVRGLMPAIIRLAARAIRDVKCIGLRSIRRIMMATAQDCMPEGYAVATASLTGQNAPGRGAGLGLTVPQIA